MKKIFLTLIMVLMVSTMAACSGAANKMQANGKQMSSSNYLLVKQSGGKVVEAELVIDKVVNAEEGSDGWYYIIPEVKGIESGDNKLYNRMGGDISVREVPTQELLDYYLNYYGLTEDRVINYQSIK